VTMDKRQAIAIAIIAFLLGLVLGLESDKASAASYQRATITGHTDSVPCLDGVVCR
jgi:hypothetical protein